MRENSGASTRHGGCERCHPKCLHSAWLRTPTPESHAGQASWRASASPGHPKQVVTVRRPAGAPWTIGLLHTSHVGATCWADDPVRNGRETLAAPALGKDCTIETACRRRASRYSSSGLMALVTCFVWTKKDPPNMWARNAWLKKCAMRGGQSARHMIWYPVGAGKGAGGAGAIMSEEDPTRLVLPRPRAVRLAHPNGMHVASEIVRKTCALHGCQYQVWARRIENVRPRTRAPTLLRSILDST